MIKGTLFILLGLLIDGLQAGISFTIATIAAFPGTAGGAAAGCAAGNYILGKVGCWAGGILLATFGSIPFVNGALATVTEPVGIALGFAINLCLSIVLGYCFLAPLVYVFVGKAVWKRLFWSAGEMIPGLNNIPFWTAFVVLSLLAAQKEKGGVIGAGAALATGSLTSGSVLGAATAGVMAMKEKTTDFADKYKALENPRLTPEYIKREKEVQDQRGDRLKSYAEDAGASGDKNEEEAARKTRQIFNDIRPIRTAAAILLALMLGTIGAQSAYAQVGAEPLRYVVNPEVPGPNQSVTIQAQGVGTFLGDATITWQQNGATVASGPGVTTFTFTTGGLGVTTRIHVSINSPSQGQFTHDFVFTPTLINLYWEAQTSVPPLYQGKALYSPGSTVRVIALPQVVASGATVTSNNLSFQWSVAGEAVAAQSGKGKNSFTFVGSQLRDGEQVAVDVYFGAALVGHGSVFIPATTPMVLLYTKDPLRGTLYDQALPSTVTLTGQEITLRAEPYYFANESLAAGTVSYDWKLNGGETSGPDSTQGVLTLRQTGAGTGEGQLSVELQNTDSSKFIQNAQTTLRLIFGGAGSNGSTNFGI